MVLLRNFQNIFKIPELTKKILFTLGALLVFRLGIFIPAIGVNVSTLANFMNQQTGSFLNFARYFVDTLAGGALEQCTIFALGIYPYISASIMMQLLSLTVPSLEELSKEGEYGRKIINQYTRYITLGLSVAYALSYALVLQNYNNTAPGLLTFSGLGFIILFTLTLTVGSMFVMWLGEQIDIFGIGNGSSLIIFAGIVSRFPSFIAQLTTFPPAKALFILALFLFITGCIVYLEKGERKIPVQYARRVVGQKVYGGQTSYIPFKVNTAGVMPIIFASALLGMPLSLFSLLADKLTFLKPIVDALTRGTFLFNVLEFALIIFFTYYYTAITYNADDLADNLKKSGGFIPGIRPGKQTASYFDYIMTRINLVGAIYLGILSVAPSLFGGFLGVAAPLISGVSLLILVGVALETSSQIEAYLIEHKYESFLGNKDNKARGRIA